MMMGWVDVSCNLWIYVGGQWGLCILHSAMKHSESGQSSASRPKSELAQIPAVRPDSAYNWQ